MLLEPIEVRKRCRICFECVNCSVNGSLAPQDKNRASEVHALLIGPEWISIHGAT